MSEHVHDEKKEARTYLLIWLALIALTVITVAVSYVHFGSTTANVVIAMLIASAKAALVALFFMHLKYEDKLTWAFAIYPIIILSLLFVATISDTNIRSERMLDHEFEQVSGEHH